MADTYDSNLADKDLKTFSTKVTSFISSPNSSYN